MAGSGDTESFYDTLERTAEFDALAGESAYQPLPDDWLVGTADIRDSSALIDAGRYISDALGRQPASKVSLAKRR